MQTSNIDQRGAIGMETRFAIARAYFRDHGIKNYMSVFAALGFDLHEHKDRITDLWNGRKKLTDADEQLLASIESSIDRLKSVRGQ